MERKWKRNIFFSVLCITMMILLCSCEYQDAVKMKADLQNIDTIHSAFESAVANCGTENDIVLTIPTDGTVSCNNQDVLEEFTALLGTTTESLSEVTVGKLRSPKVQGSNIVCTFIDGGDIEVKCMEDPRICSSNDKLAALLTEKIDAIELHSNIFMLIACTVGGLIIILFVCMLIDYIW